ncbi:SDR family oxidoreductase [Amycolatopsis sp. NPDC059657]|uniref:SDR family oxidoreductase n=1 Tax=Amycolatopsis sp. NPDC059657 TaxID=3346899 RepID=UPI00366A7EE2
MADLTGKTALVTGASRGIGRGIARRLAADGALVAVHYGSNDTAAKETVTAIEHAGGAAFPVKAPLGVDGDVETLLTGLKAGLDGRPLDILVNNAGSGGPGSLTMATPATFDETFAVNVRAPFFLLQQALPLLNDGGRVVLISSSITRMPLPAALVYGMTKGALEMLGRTLAIPLGQRQITVNVVSPGVTDTDLIAPVREQPGIIEALSASIALGRIGQPADIADAVALLVSDDGRWITGQVIEVSGGANIGVMGV